MKRSLLVTIISFLFVIIYLFLPTATSIGYPYPIIALERSVRQTDCDQGQLNPFASDTENLDEDADNWGIYCEGSPMWIMETVESPSLDDSALRCSIAGGAANSNVYCFRQLLADPSATQFNLTLSFWVDETTCNNEGGTSVVQALEFSFNSYQDSSRYEWAVQWENVGDGAPQWRYWDPSQPVGEEWVPIHTGLTQCLEGGRWHTLTLTGEIVNGQVHYDSFTVDDLTQTLDVTVPALHTENEPDRLAIAVQLDGNANQSPYDVFIDNVSFERSSGGQFFTHHNSNARSCASVTCQITAVVPCGTLLNVVGTIHGETVNGDDVWYRVDYFGTEVYIHSSLISTHQPACEDESTPSGTETGTPIEPCPNQSNRGAGNLTPDTFNVDAGYVIYISSHGFDGNYQGYLTTLVGPYHHQHVIENGVWCGPVPANSAQADATYNYILAACGSNCPVRQSRGPD